MATKASLLVHAAENWRSLKERVMHRMMHHPQLHGDYAGTWERPVLNANSILPRAKNLMSGSIPQRSIVFQLGPAGVKQRCWEMDELLGGALIPRLDRYHHGLRAVIESSFENMLFM